MKALRMYVCTLIVNVHTYILNAFIKLNSIASVGRFPRLYYLSVDVQSGQCGTLLVMKLPVSFVFYITCALILQVKHLSVTFN